MSVIDISRPLSPQIANWPGDEPFQIKPTLRRTTDQPINLSGISTSLHLGTHVDAPWHFTDDGIKMLEVPLTTYWGPAQVVSVNKTSGALFPSDLADYDLRLAPRLLIHSLASHADPTTFHHDFVYPSTELSAFLDDKGIILFGTDAPSVDPPDSKTLDGHLSLNRHGIMILEGLQLSDVADGLYELVALPLPLVGLDGSLVRAVLRQV